ncbi:unnamed protein product [Paramecium octaurelia]|uniref:Uncharacterized protein n=1 Tax=Paramecium octaurelia TaxID=43137 RepID=A0A8S1SFM2_PAROT|nr:unnamed protein product [Paramecium octaurelia]
MSMNPNDDQQRLYQMFQQMGNPDPYGRMLPVPNPQYYSCWTPPFPQPMMPPPPNQKYPFPEQFMHDQALQMNSLQPNQGGMNLNGMPQGLPNMPPMPIGFGMPPMGPGQLPPGAMGPGPLGTMGTMGPMGPMGSIGPMGPMGPGPMQLPGMGPMPQGPIGQMPPFDFQFKQQPQLQQQLGPNQMIPQQQQQQQQQQQPPQQQQLQQQPQPQQQAPQIQQQQQQQANQNTNTNNNSINQQNNLEQGFSQVVNEFQLKILNMFVQQNQMLLDFKNKNASLESVITQILDEITNLQRIVEQKFDNGQTEDFVSRLSIPHQEMTHNNILLKSLSYNLNEFQYQLVLVNDLDTVLFKDKNFNLEIALKDMKGQDIKNKNKIELEIQLYSSDDKPIILQHNSQNQVILRLPEDNIWLEDGIVEVEKLQINEVTSHYQNGWVHMIVFPIKNNTKIGSDDINPALIKPLILQIVVKSKKTFKKSSRSRSRSHERLRRLEKLENKSSSESEQEIEQKDMKMSQEKQNGIDNEKGEKENQIEEQNEDEKANNNNNNNNNKNDNEQQKENQKEKEEIYQNNESES